MEAIGICCFDDFPDDFVNNFRRTVMERETFTQKIKRRMCYEIRRRLSGAFYLMSFRSYWHYLFNKKKAERCSLNLTCYYAARPNIGAGIGHQMANWIAGYWFAKRFSVKFCNIPFSTDEWDAFLGFGRGETQYYDLLKNGYNVRRLPGFDEHKATEVSLNQAIINSYSGTKIVLLAYQDQGYDDQFGVMDILKEKFYSAPARKTDVIKYDREKFNIAVHVRRTVIIANKVIEENDEVKARRWLSNDYYEKVLVQVLDNLETDKSIAIWLFSTGRPEEFAEFSKYGEVHFCSDMNEYQSFAHLVYADLLITSKSSFSYKPALMNNGIKVCPRNFWHGYPKTKDWVLCENDGTLDLNKLKEAFR